MCFNPQQSIIIIIGWLANNLFIISQYILFITKHHLLISCVHRLLSCTTKMLGIKSTVLNVQFSNLHTNSRFLFNGSNHKCNPHLILWTAFDWVIHIFYTHNTYITDMYFYSTYILPTHPDEEPQQSGAQLSERLASLGIMETQLRAPLKPLKHHITMV